MQNKYFKLFIIVLVVAIVLPQVVLAAWWNPFSWNWGWVNSIFHFQQTAQKQEQQIKKTEPTIVGGDKDAHGCIGSAGYSWCEIKQKCLRVWEEKCETGQTSGSSTPAQQATDDRKTYTNNELGIEFKYPKDWIVANGKGGAINVWTLENKKEYDASSTTAVYPEFSVIYWDKASFLTKATEAAGKNITNAKDFVLAQFTRTIESTRDGRPAYAGIASGKNAAYIEYVEANNGVYVLTVSYPENTAQNPKTQLNGQILSSFKFTK